MFSKQYKLELLKKFYLNTKIKDVKFKCPFNKIYKRYTDKMEIWDKIPCRELCGLWPELGDVQSGCPCETLGTMESLRQLERVLIKEGYLDSNGNDI